MTPLGAYIDQKTLVFPWLIWSKYLTLAREKNSVREVCSSDIVVTATQNWKWLAVSEMCVAVKLITIFNLKIIRLFINLKIIVF